MPSLLMRRVGGLLCFDLLQHRREPLVVDDRARLHCLDLVEHPERQRDTFVPDSKAPDRRPRYGA